MMITRDEVEMMNTTQSFTDLAHKADVIQAKCRDHKTMAKNITMSNNITLDFDGESLPMSTLASGHLCGKLEVPSRYFTRLVETGRNNLAAENINTWLENNSKTLFLREYDGHVRGVLSGSYAVYDAPEILSAVADVYDLNSFVLKGSYINEERMHLRLVEKVMMDVEGEDLFAGISLDSSDVGRSALSVKFFIWKQICTNGLVIAKRSSTLFRQKHIGITNENFRQGLRTGLDSFFELKDQISAKINETRKLPTNENLEELLEEIKKNTGLDDESSAEVIEYMVQKYDRSQWGLINGITEVAQKFPLERQIELETIAGNMLAA